ncbi:MAG: pyruvate kinase [Candidatus Peribacteraceae bacterium]|nr:pyruvate kinase [Candidatus Peribacteraceae bacterium]
MRFTKIVCTLGPSTNTKESIRSLVDAGMNVARINLSHGSLEQHLQTIRTVKEINEELKAAARIPTCVGILLDTKGAEIRTGDVTEKIQIKAGQEVLFSSKPLPKEKRTVIMVNHEHFDKDVLEAELILIDNGLLSFDIVSTDRKSGTVTAKALENGSIGSRRHVNLPGANLSMPSITPKDWEDIAFAAKEGVDFLALSFIREAKEVEEVRGFLTGHSARIALISKIETRQAVRNIQEIIEASDGIMVARGDLGVEVPFESVPAIQDDLVLSSRRAGKPVIVATHMLESMIDQPMPTRAEVTDIAHAAMSRTDATMLSGETASGEFPFESVGAMDRVLLATEEHITQNTAMEESPVENERAARAHAAVTLAVTTRADSLFVMTRSGQTARDVAKYRPNVPIIAFTDVVETQRALQLTFGVVPILIPFSSKDPEKTVRDAIAAGKAMDVLHKGDHVVLVSDSKAGDESVNTVQLRRIP